MGKWKLTVIFAAACITAFSSFKVINAAVASATYRILISEQTTISNTSLKTGGPYSLFGTTGQLGFGTISSPRYAINWGSVNSWRPPQDNVDTSHAYPNPCNISKGCNGVTFTRLTLKATVRVYTVSGELVRTIEKDGNLDSIGWDLKTNNGSQAASGLYIYLNEGGGTAKKGKLVIVR